MGLKDSPNQTPVRPFMAWTGRPPLVQSPGQSRRAGDLVIGPKRRWEKSIGADGRFG
jgi:hypothetical protein